MSALAELSLEAKVGQLFLVGFPGGQEGEEAFRASVAARPFGNAILFSRNCATAAAAASAVSSARSAIRAACGVEALVAVDQEGGVVARLADGVTPIPGAMAIAAAVAGDGASLVDVESVAYFSGTELLSLGIDWNLAPVADVNSNPANPVIGVRSFGEDPETVAGLASAYASGLRRAGVAATAKHFPGHGDTSVDSHLGLPRVDAGLERLRSVELAPFRRLISDGIASVMTSHVLFPAVEPEPIPATLSAKVLGGLLRGELGFRGVIVTDCLEMKAVDGRFDDLAVRAILAGADVVTVSHDRAKQDAAFDSVVRAVRDGSISEARLDESVGRVLAMKAAVREAGLRARPSGTEADAASSLRLAERLAEASISLIGGAALPDASRGGCYIDVASEASSGAEDGGDLEAAARRAELAAATSPAAALRRLGSALKTIELPPDPDDAQIAEAVRLAETSGGPVFVGIHALSRHPGQAALAERVSESCRKRGVPLAFALTRDPYDAATIGSIAGADRAILCAYERSRLSADALAKAVSGFAAPRGRCPVDALSAERR